MNLPKSNDRELDLCVARALGLELIDRATAIRLSNEHNARRPKQFVGTIELVPTPWDGWYAHDWYVREEPERTFFTGYNPVENYRFDLDKAMDALHALGVDRIRLDFDAAYGPEKRTGWSVHVDGACLVQFADTAPEAVCHAIIKWRALCSTDARS